MTVSENCIFLSDPFPFLKSLFFFFGVSNIDFELICTGHTVERIT
jgi:hypothetical protein